MSYVISPVWVQDKCDERQTQSSHYLTGLSGEESFVYWRTIPNIYNRMGMNTAGHGVLVPKTQLDVYINITCTDDNISQSNLKLGGRFYPSNSGCYFSNGIYSILYNSRVGNVCWNNRENPPTNLPMAFAWDGSWYGDDIFSGNNMPTPYADAPETATWSKNKGQSTKKLILSSVARGYWQRVIADEKEIFGLYKGKGIYTGKALMVGNATWISSDIDTEIVMSNTKQDGEHYSYGEFAWQNEYYYMGIAPSTDDEDEGRYPLQIWRASEAPTLGKDWTIELVQFDTKDSEGVLIKTGTAIWQGFSEDKETIISWICDPPQWRART